MQARVIYCSNPLDYVNDRQIVDISRKRRVDRLAPKTTLPFIAVLNGEPILRENNGWKRCVKDKDILVFVTLPQGGGGGSNPLKLALMVALSFAAPGMGTFLANEMGIAGAGFMASTTVFGSVTVGQIFGMAISFMGSQLLNALMPNATPKAYDKGGYNSISPSPTYSLTAQGNQARLQQPIPVIYGKHLVYPDFAAEPYVEYSGNEQYLYQLMAVGMGEYTIHQIRIEDTDISEFEEVTYEIVKPGSAVTLFPTNVVTASEASGQELKNCIKGSYSASGTTLTVTTTAAHAMSPGDFVRLDATSGSLVDENYRVVTVPTTTTFTVTLTSPLTATGNVNTYIFAGLYTVNASQTTINSIAVDISFSKGLFYANDSGGLDSRSVSWRVIAQQIDDAGNSIGSVITLGSESFTAATNTPQRKTYRYSLSTPGRYKVAVVRTSEEDTSPRAGNSIELAGIRGYIPASNIYPCTLIAVRIRATNNITSTSARRFNVLVTRKLYVMDAGRWSSAPVETRSIAWAAADLLKSSYGGATTDARIDIQKLQKLEKIWAARGDTFDGIFDTRMTVWEALQSILRLGRTRPFIQSGIVRFVRDQAETLPVAMFNMRNIVKGTLKTQYIMNDTDTADSVTVEYFDNVTWKPAEVTASLPGSDTANPAKIKLFGCTDRSRAWKEGMYMAAQNRYRRQMITFDTEMEGFIPALGDLIAISHDRPNWGTSGEVLGMTATSNLITYSDDVTNGAWAQTAISSIVANSLAAPTGALTADLVYPSATTGIHSLKNAMTSLNDNATISVSSYFNSVDFDKAHMSFTDKTGAVTYLEYDYKTKTVLTAVKPATQSSCTFDIEELSSGWIRIKMNNLNTKSGATLPALTLAPIGNFGLSNSSMFTPSGVTITANNIETIYTGWNADTMYETATTARHYTSTTYNAVAGKTMSFDILVRTTIETSLLSRFIGIYFPASTGLSAAQGFTLDPLVTGTVVHQTGLSMSNIATSYLANGWYLIKFDLTPTATGTISLNFCLMNAAGTYTTAYLGDVNTGLSVLRPVVSLKNKDFNNGVYTSPIYGITVGTGLKSFSAWGGQVEYASSVGTYIGTTSAPSSGAILTLSEPVDMSNSSANYYVALRNTDGSVAGPFNAARVVGSDYNVNVTGMGSFVPYYGHEKEKTYFAFGPGEAYSRSAKVISVKPKSVETVEIQAINEDPAVHTAELSTSPAASTYWNLPSVISKPTITGINVNFVSTSNGPAFDISWLPAAGASKYVVEITFDSGSTWKRLGEAFTNHFTTPAHFGLITLRIAAMSEFALGDWTYWTGDPYAAPPPNLATFTVAAQPDGTRQFDWSFIDTSPPDIAGYKIRYRLSTGWTWDDMYDLHTGMLLASPYENNQLPSGIYTFAIKAYDSSGHESVNATFIEGNLPDPRLAGILYQVRPNTEGWPGTLTSCFVQPENNVLASNDTKTWTDFATWADYTRWIQSPTTLMVYEYPVIDVGYVVGFKPLASAVGSGTQTVEEAHSNDGITYTPWANLGGQIIARYLKIRITVIGSAPRLTSMDIKLDGDAKSEDQNDLDTSTLTGSYSIAPGDIRIPLMKTYNAISQVQVSLQNVGPGWSWEVVDKNAMVGPRIKIYNAAGVLANAVIDVYIRGF